MKLEKIKAVTEIATPWISAAAIGIGGIFASYQYLERVKADRVRETMVFMERFNRSPFTDSRYSITRTWEKHFNEQERLLINESLKADDFNDWIVRTIAEEGIGPDVLLIIEFFDSLGSCVKQGVCDATTAFQFFGEEALFQYHQHYAKIQFETDRRLRPSLGKPLLEFCVMYTGLPETRQDQTS